MPIHSSVRPRCAEADAVRLAETLFGKKGTARELPAERDRNFLLRSGSGEEFVLKIYAAGEERATLDLQNAALCRLADREPELKCPRVIPALSGDCIAQDASGPFVRLLTYLPGKFLAESTPQAPELLRDLGTFLGTLDRGLEGLEHPAMDREFVWDLARGPKTVQSALDAIADPGKRALVESYLRRFERDAGPVLPRLRRQVVHHDANDYNVIVEGERVAGLIDFGDMLRSYVAAEPAVAAAYVMMGKDDPVSAAAHVVGGYHSVFELRDEDLEALPHLIVMRLCMTVGMAAAQRRREPDNEYLGISEAPAWAVLEKLKDVPPRSLEYALRHACRRPEGMSAEEIGTSRRASLGPSLSVSYRKPLHIVRGWMQYLYDADGRIYLDAANNVPHVGHGHPRVVRAAQEQMAVLNTNTRYLHENVVMYAERLTALLPEPLRVCFFVNSGSEANDLALRLARTFTRATDVLVLDGAYHGNLSSLIDLSPYKFDGPGGAGAPDHVHPMPLPDVYRGRYRRSDPQSATKYAAHVADAVKAARRSGRDIAAFFAESLPGCGGQIEFPEGYLREAYAQVRLAGGLCVADEVQVGFSRVGTHVWGFETQGVLPDIVTMGKPIGNGHPLGAVVTTPEIAAAFNNGMEYFNTYGGNPVSCAIGLAVLDVLRDQKLQENALRVGKRLKEALDRLREKHALIGDVRGRGLYLGVELVRDRASLEPAAEEASEIAERMKDRGILLGVDGPLHNVLKIKPPLVFTSEDADFLAATLDAILSGMK